MRLSVCANFESDTEGLSACLCEEGAFLALEESAGRSLSQLGIGRTGGGEKCHELMARRGCGILAWCRRNILGEIQLWGEGERETRRG